MTNEDTNWELFRWDALRDSVGCVGRVWIDIPDGLDLPWHWNVHDYGTGEEIEKIVKLQIIVEVHERTVVDLWFENGKIERHELLPKPKT